MADHWAPGDTMETRSVEVRPSRRRLSQTKEDFRHMDPGRSQSSSLGQFDVDKVVGTLEGDWSDWFTQTHHHQNGFISHFSLRTAEVELTQSRCPWPQSSQNWLILFWRDAASHWMSLCCRPSASTSDWPEYSSQVIQLETFFLPHRRVNGAQHVRFVLKVAVQVWRDQVNLCGPHVPLCTRPVEQQIFLLLDIKAGCRPRQWSLLRRCPAHNTVWLFTRHNKQPINLEWSKSAK